jgi:hypothetical protein
MAFDADADAERLHRYQSSKTRELHKTLELLMKLRKSLNEPESGAGSRRKQEPVQSDPVPQAPAPAASAGTKPRPKPMPGRPLKDRYIPDAALELASRLTNEAARMFINHKIARLPASPVVDMSASPKVRNEAKPAVVESGVREPARKEAEEGKLVQERQVEEREFLEAAIAKVVGA